MTDDTAPIPPPDPMGTIVADIALLYELAMAVGRSLDLRSNCEQFIRVLMARKNLSYAAVWLRRDLLVDTPLNRAVPEADDAFARDVAEVFDSAGGADDGLADDAAVGGDR